MVQISSQLEEKIRVKKTEGWQRHFRALLYARSVGQSNGIDFPGARHYISRLSSCEEQGSRILDIGAGTGALAIPLAAAGYRVTAVDASNAMLRQLKRSDKFNAVTTEVVDVFSQEISHQPFDAAVSRWFVPHFHNWVDILHWAAACLKDGGHFIFDLPQKSHVARVARGEIQVPDEQTFQYDHAVTTEDVNPAAFYAVVDDQELGAALSLTGFELVSRTPT